MDINKQALDRWITGNYGEDQFVDESDDVSEVEYRVNEVANAINNLVGILEEIGFDRDERNQDVIDLSNKVDKHGMEIVTMVHDFMRKEKEKN